MERKIAKQKFKILMVCLGNICRSPMAQGAMEFMAKKNSLSLIVDSAGTQNWHFNKSPDQRAQNVATSKGWKISYQKARQILSSDFKNFDLIIGMDISNIVDIEKIRPKGAMDLAIISAKGCFHIRKKILAILMLKYKKDANHAKGT